MTNISDDRTAGRSVGRDPSSAHAEEGEERPVDQPDTGDAESMGGRGLLDSEDRSAYERRWNDIQARFVDEPRRSVEEADDLVSEVQQRIAEQLTSHRRGLEERWGSGSEPTTEELRRAVQQYREFFNRLVTDQRL